MAFTPLIAGKTFLIHRGWTLPSQTNMIEKDFQRYISNPKEVRLSDKDQAYRFLPQHGGYIANIDTNGMPVFSGPFTGCIFSMSGGNAYNVHTGGENYRKQDWNEGHPKKGALSS